MKTFVLALISIWLLTGCVQLNTTPATTPESEISFAEDLQQILDDGLKESGGIGVSAAVAVPGYRIWTGISGVSHENMPITEDSLFCVGSITKNFTAAAILLLAEEGLLDLNDPLGHWFPDYPNIDGSITLRELLNHTGGIHDYVEHPDYWRAALFEPEKVDSPEEILQGYVLEPYFSKGTDWHYSTTGYILLRMLVEKATGLEAPAVFRDRLWTPLGLNNMFLAGKEPLPEPVAHGWWDLDGDGAYDDLTIHGNEAFYSGTDGNVFSTAKDLAVWSQALFYERQVLSEGSFDQMLDFHTPIPGEPLVDGYGLGAVRFSPAFELFDGLEIWGHGGNAPGYAAAMLYLPEYDVTIVLLDNTEKGEALEVLGGLLSAVTGHLEKIR